MQSLKTSIYPTLMLQIMVELSMLQETVPQSKILTSQDVFLTAVMVEHYT